MVALSRMLCFSLSVNWRWGLITFLLRRFAGRGFFCPWPLIVARLNESRTARSMVGTRARREVGILAVMMEPAEASRAAFGVALSVAHARLALAQRDLFILFTLREFPSFDAVLSLLKLCGQAVSRRELEDRIEDLLYDPETSRSVCSVCMCVSNERALSCTLQARRGTPRLAQPRRQATCVDRVSYLPPALCHRRTVRVSRKRCMG